MAFPTAQNRANMRDASFIVSRTIPAAGASNGSTGFDIVGGTPNLSGTSVNQQPPTGIELVVDWSALTLTSTKTITFAAEDSADNSSFAAIGSLASRTLTGNGSNVGVAGSFRWVLPPDCRRYVRVKLTSEASNGAVTTETVTVQLAFK